MNASNRCSDRFARPASRTRPRWGTAGRLALAVGLLLLVGAGGVQAITWQQAVENARHCQERAEKKKPASASEWSIAIHTWSIALKLRPDDAEAKEAMEYCRRQRCLAQVPWAVDRAMTAQKSAEGSVPSDEGKWREASRMWKMVLQFDPSHARARDAVVYCERSMELAKRQRLIDEARTMQKQAEQADPQDKSLWSRTHAKWSKVLRLDGSNRKAQEGIRLCEKRIQKLFFAERTDRFGGHGQRVRGHGRNAATEHESTSVVPRPASSRGPLRTSGVTTIAAGSEQEPSPWHDESPERGGGSARPADPGRPPKSQPEAESEETSTRRTGESGSGLAEWLHQPALWIVAAGLGFVLFVRLRR